METKEKVERLDDMENTKCSNLHEKAVNGASILLGWNGMQVSAASAVGHPWNSAGSSSYIREAQDLIHRGDK